MTAFRRFALRLLALLRPAREEAEMSRAIRAHLQLLEDKFVAQGMSTEDARNAALRAFGGVEQAKEHQRDTRTIRWLDNCWLDLKLGARILAKYPGLTLVGGLGMAVATAICAVSFTIVYSYLHPTLPLDEGERIVGIENWDAAINNDEERSLHDFLTWRRELRSLEDVSAFRQAERNFLTSDGQYEAVSVAEMSASGFALARVSPLLGRPFGPEDEQEGAPAVVVISHDMWRTLLASDRKAIGQTVRLGSVAHTIIGVMPAGFAFPLNNRAWIPFRANPSHYARRRGPIIVVAGRLARGVSLQEARAELATIGNRTATLFPETHKHLRPRIVSYTEVWVDAGSLAEFHAAQFLITMLLVVVCVNVAILVYARTATRQSEITVRCALGASRGRIIMQLFCEALALSVVATAAGLVLAQVALSQINHAVIYYSAQFGGVPFWINFGLSSGAVTYAVGLSVLSALIVGILPAWKATGRKVRLGFTELGRGSGMQLGKTWTALIVLQVAAAVAVLPAAIFYAKQFAWHGNAQPGFGVEEFLTARLLLDSDIPPTAKAKAYQRNHIARYWRLQDKLIGKLKAQPEVSEVIRMTRIPGAERQARVEPESTPADPQGTPAPALQPRGVTVGVGHVDLNFFDAFHIPTLSGRRFQPADTSYSAASGPDPVGADNDGHVDSPERPKTTVVIVNRSFVDNVLAGGNALGRRVRYVRRDVPDHWYEIVGVVADFPAVPTEPDQSIAKLYHPLVPEQDQAEILAIRIRGGGPTRFAGRLREITLAQDPALRLRGVLSLDEVLREAQGVMRMGALAISIATLSVLLLSAAGIYALMSVTVTRRRKEIGIRVALGAQPRLILQSIFARALVQLAIGIALGAVAAAWLDMASEGDLMGGEWAVLLPLVAVFMTIVGILAAWEPARRGFRIQPFEALREE